MHKLLRLPVPARHSRFRAEEADHEIHQELRGILTTVQNAINSGNYDAMLPVLSENVRATTITQEVMSEPPGRSRHTSRIGSGRAAF